MLLLKSQAYDLKTQSLMWLKSSFVFGKGSWEVQSYANLVYSLTNIAKKEKKKLQENAGKKEINEKENQKQSSTPY